MTYYNYHSAVKKQIQSGELLYYYFDLNYKNIGFALVLCFENKKFPIRENHFEEYFELIGKNYVTVCRDNKCFTKFMSK